MQNLNTSGIATFDGIQPQGEFLRFASHFGTVRVHAQTDGRGISTLVTGSTYAIRNGVVETPWWNEQLFHTDGTKMADPPGAVALYCETPDPHSPRVNVFASARDLYRKLTAEDPGLLEALRQPIDFGEFVSAVFPFDGDTRLTSVRFRQAPEPPRMGLSDEIRSRVDALLRGPDLLRGVTLDQGQGVIFNNNLVPWPRQVNRPGARRQTRPARHRARLTHPPWIRDLDISLKLGLDEISPLAGRPLASRRGLFRVSSNDFVALIY